MTVHKKLLIEPKDIVGIGYECPHCGAVYTVPLDKLDRTLPFSCSNCNESLIADISNALQDDPERDILLHLIRSIQHFQREGAKVGAVIRLEIKEEPPK